MENEPLMVANSDIEEFGREMQQMLHEMTTWESAQQEEICEQDITTAVRYNTYLIAKLEFSQKQTPRHYPKSYPLKKSVAKTLPVPVMTNNQWMNYCTAFARVRDEIIRSNSSRKAHRFSVADFDRLNLMFTDLANLIVLLEEYTPLDFPETGGSDAPPFTDLETDD